MLQIYIVIDLIVYNICFHHIFISLQIKIYNAMLLITMIFIIEKSNTVLENKTIFCFRILINSFNWIINYFCYVRHEVHAPRVFCDIVTKKWGYFLQYLGLTQVWHNCSLVHVNPKLIIKQIIKYSNLTKKKNRCKFCKNEIWLDFVPFRNFNWNTTKF